MNDRPGTTVEPGIGIQGWQAKLLMINALVDTLVGLLSAIYSVVFRKAGHTKPDAAQSEVSIGPNNKDRGNPPSWRNVNCEGRTYQVAFNTKGGVAIKIPPTMDDTDIRNMTRLLVASQNSPKVELPPEIYNDPEKRGMFLKAITAARTEFDVAQYKKQNNGQMPSASQMRDMADVAGQQARVSCGTERVSYAESQAALSQAKVSGGIQQRAEVKFE